MDGKAIAAAIKTATTRRAQESGAAARRALWALIEAPAPIPRASSYYEWLADEVKYDTHFRWANGAFRSAGVWASLGRMDVAHLPGFASALRAVVEQPGNLLDRPVLWLVCAGAPRGGLDALLARPEPAASQAMIRRMQAVAVLCLAPRAATPAFTAQLTALASDPIVLRAAHRLCADAIETVSFWDLELMTGLLGLLHVEGSEASRAALTKVLAFLKTETRDARNVLRLADAQAVLASYGALPAGGPPQPEKRRRTPSRPRATPARGRAGKARAVSRRTRAP